MGTKITFDPDAREFICDGPPVDGVIEIDLQVDLYSDGKEDWRTDPTLTVMKFPVDAKGGDPFGSVTLGDAYLILHGWAFRPHESDHTLRLVGDIGTAGGWDLIKDTVGSFRVAAEYQTSALVFVREVGTSGLTAAESAALIRIDEGVFGQKATQESTDPATKPGYILLYDDAVTPVLLGHKEIYQDNPPTLGWVKGKDIMFEGVLTAGAPPP